MTDDDPVIARLDLKTGFWYVRKIVGEHWVTFWGATAEDAENAYRQRFPKYEAKHAD